MANETDGGGGGMTGIVVVLVLVILVVLFFWMREEESDDVELEINGEPTGALVVPAEPLALEGPAGLTFT